MNHYIKKKISYLEVKYMELFYQFNICLSVNQNKLYLKEM
jgi:hypothetical protein